MLINKSLSNFRFLWSSLSRASPPHLQAASLVHTTPSMSRVYYDERSLAQPPHGVSVKNMRKWLDECNKYNAKLVYVGPLNKQMFTAKFFSLSSSMTGILIWPLLAQNLSTSGLLAQAMVFGTTGFFIVITPLLLQALTRKYVSRLYYNYEEKRFTAIMYTFLMGEYKLEFNMEDVVVPDVPGMFTTFHVPKLKRTFFAPLDNITDLEIQRKILGYDKPLDLNKYHIKSKKE